MSVDLGGSAEILVEPIGDRILVKPEPEGETKKGSIVIPSTAQEKPQLGLILAMGPTANAKHQELERLRWESRRVWELVAMGSEVTPERVHYRGEATGGQLELGQRILYGKFSGTEITVEGEDYLILREEDVLAILHSPTGGDPA